MQGQAVQETVQGGGAAGGEVGTEAVATDVLHLMLVGQGGNGALGVFVFEGFPEENEVREAAADGEVGAGEGLEI